MSEQFWLNNPKNLINKKNFSVFVPYQNQTFDEKLNAITRFCIYFIILILLTTKNLTWIGLALSCIFFIIYLQKTEQFKELRKPPKCTMPTRDNPFMNFTMGDFIENPERTEACDILDKKVNQVAKKHFNFNLYKNSFDIFDREINKRPWITMPVTQAVNKQTEFAEWLYGDMGHCKSAGINCLKNRDIRYHKL
jgi:hypothetical protein